MTALLFVGNERSLMQCGRIQSIDQKGKNEAWKGHTANYLFLHHFTLVKIILQNDSILATSTSNIPLQCYGQFFNGCLTGQATC